MFFLMKKSRQLVAPFLKNRQKVWLNQSSAPQLRHSPDIVIIDSVDLLTDTTRIVIKELLFLPFSLSFDFSFYLCWHK